MQSLDTNGAKEFEPTLPLRTTVAIKIVGVASSVANLLLKFSKAIVPFANAFGLGFLNKEKITQLVRYNYVSQPDYYNPENYNYNWEEDIIDPLKKASQGRNLLVAFCGKGREAEIFSRHDYIVTGIDRESFMIDDAIKISKQKGFNAKFECADFNKFTTTNRYEIVYTSTWMFTTYLDETSRRQFLNKCKELCSKNGIIIISYRIRRGDKIDMLSYIIAKTVAFISLGNRTTCMGDRIENGLFWHYFTEPEIENELKRAGMETCYHQPSNDGKLEWRFLRPTTCRS